MLNVIPLGEVQSLTAEEAVNLFSIPTKYNHVGAKFNPQPVWIEFSKIRALDEQRGEGRLGPHSPEEIQQLKHSFRNGVDTWQELPAVTYNTDEAFDKFDYNMVFGYGRVEALLETGQTGHWFLIVEGTEYQISWIRVIENVNLTPEFKQGEALIIHHLNTLLAKGAILNTEDKIRAEIKKQLPNISQPSLGRVTKTIFETHATPLRYQTWGKAKIKKWLEERADQAAMFETGGNFDIRRTLHGYATKNVLDPLHNPLMKYASTGKKSYLVLHVNAPHGSGSLHDLRKAQVDTLKKYVNAYAKSGMKNNPLEILGFMPQDFEDEDMRFLVDVHGRPTGLDVPVQSEEAA